MIETLAISLLTATVLTIFLGKLFQNLGQARACPSYSVECDKKLTIDPDAEEMKILILGDFGSGTKNQHLVAEASEKTCQERGCDLVLLAGDNFIQKGISGLKDEQLNTKFESVYRQQVPFFAILGNHDLRGDWRAQIDYTKVSERWNMPANNYDLNAGPVRIYAINTSCSIKTLWRLFKSTAKPWRLALGHHPAISSGRHGGMTWLERWVISLSGVDFFVSGHNHVLEHTEGRGFDQVVSGGGGSSLNRAKKAPLQKTRFIQEGFGYTWAHFTAQQASFHYFDISGKEIYYFTRSKQRNNL